MSSSTVLHLITSAKTLFPNTVTFQVTGHVFWGPLFNPLRVVSLDPRVLTVTGKMADYGDPPEDQSEGGNWANLGGLGLLGSDLSVRTAPAQSISLAAL